MPFGPFKPAPPPPVEVKKEENDLVAKGVTIALVGAAAYAVKSTLFGSRNTHFRVPPFASTKGGKEIMFSITNGYAYPKRLMIVDELGQESLKELLQPGSKLSFYTTTSTVFRVRDAGNNAEEELLWLDGYAGYKVVSYTLKPDNFQCKFKSEPAGKPIKFKVTNDSGNNLTAVWVDEAGKSYTYDTFYPGDTKEFESFENHAWRFKHTNGSTVSWFKLGKDQNWNGMEVSLDR